MTNYDFVTTMALQGRYIDDTTAPNNGLKHIGPLAQLVEHSPLKRYVFRLRTPRKWGLFGVIYSLVVGKGYVS